jgi:hypothetical protein
MRISALVAAVFLTAGIAFAGEPTFHTKVKVDQLVAPLLKAATHDGDAALALDAPNCEPDDDMMHCTYNVEGHTFIHVWSAKPGGVPYKATLALVDKTSSADFLKTFAYVIRVYDPKLSDEQRVELVATLTESAAAAGGMATVRGQNLKYVMIGGTGLLTIGLEPR